MDTNIQNISGGGVGEAYPGSTGGEIFNYYGTDSNANTASGNYSTTIGYNNKNSGSYSFCGGKDNYLEYDYTQYPSFIFGSNNGSSGVKYKNCIVLGYGNKGSPSGARFKILGESNTISYPGGTTIGDNINCNGGYYFGQGLAGKPAFRDQCIMGFYNKSTTALDGRIIIIGAGIDSSQPKNAIEINNTTCKILNNLQLATDTTEVNAITPAKSSPASADDMTLVTKSYITSQSINYEPSSEVQLSAVTSYSLGTLIGDPNWSFPYSSGSITLVFSVDGVFHTVHIPIPSYFSTTTHPIIKAPLTDIHNYQITNPGDSGTLKGLLLFYNPTTKEISLENPECINIDNVGDSISDAFNYGNIDVWFWGMTCYNHF